MNGLAVVISARSNSSRLPRKALLSLGGRPLIQFLIDRLRTSQLCREFIFATTTRADDNELAAVVAGLGLQVLRGSDNDVALRHIEVAQRYRLKWVLRVTGDCPFVDGLSLDHCMRQWRPGPVLTTTKGVFPVGIDYELLSVEALEAEWPKMSVEEREHLTLRFYRADLGFKTASFGSPEWPKSQESYTVDTLEDFERASAKVRQLGKLDFSIAELLNLERR
jgi:spore coat polysaccharide biosynthesis protein SpsF (cytidylyltransferase family)